MGKKIYVIVIIILGIIGIMMIGKALKKDESKKEGKEEGEIVAVNSLKELFASEEGETYKYKEGEKEYKVKVTEVEEKEGERIVKTEREIKEENGEYIIEMKYEIGEEKVVESGRHIKEGKEVSTIYATEILVDGLPYEGKTWKSVDGQTEYKITKMRDKKVEIEGTREGIKETRVIEVGKGVVEVRVESTTQE